MLVIDEFPFAKNSADVNALVTLLDKVAVGAIASYSALSECVDRDIQKHRYLLDSALNRLLKQRKVFACVKNSGMQRLSDSEIVLCSFSALKRIRGMARKSVTRLTAVQWDGLSQDDKTRHNLHLSVLGAIVFSAQPRNIAKLGMACKNSSSSGLPTARTLKLLAV